MTRWTLQAMVTLTTAACSAIEVRDAPVTWQFHPIAAKTRDVRADDVLGVENRDGGRGFYVSNPFRVIPGKRYRLTVQCRTEHAPRQAAFARVFWYRGPDRGRASEIAPFTDTQALGGTQDWTTLTTPDGVAAPADAELAVVRLESHEPKGADEPPKTVALAGRAIYQENWRTLLSKLGVAFRDRGAWFAPAEFADHPMVVLCHTGPGRALTVEETAELGRYVESGGVLVLVLGSAYNLVGGGKDVSALPWLGAKRTSYGRHFEACRVLDTDDRLTAGLTPNAQVYSYTSASGRLPGLLRSGLTTARALVGTDTHCLLAVNRVGDGCVVFTGNSPPDAADPFPDWYAIFERLSAPMAARAPAPPPVPELFTVQFRQVVFAPE